MCKKIIICIMCMLVQSISALLDVTVDQSLQHAGFHRLLITNITLYANLTSCKFLAEEKFSQDFYIAHHVIKDFNQTNDALIKLSHRLNTEVFASAATPFSAYVFLNNSQPLTTSTEFLTTYTYFIPIRVRYHDPQSGGGFKEFRKQPVLLYARCPEGTSWPKTAVSKLPCDPFSPDICDWNAIPFTQKNLLPPVVIPVGDTDSFSYVFISTYIVAYSGLFILLYSLFLVK